ncbi:MAG: aldehyde dehydrogenase family protein [Fibrobacterota bacterium]
MNAENIPETVLNSIGGKSVACHSGELFDKFNPHDGSRLCRAARSKAEDVSDAVLAAKAAQPGWGRTAGVKRGEVLYAIADNLLKHKAGMARRVALETGKSLKDALGETDGAIALARFMAAEGQRLYGRTTTSGTDNKTAFTVREPVGVVGLIISANTPIANIAWKVFPALICGNAAILKASEDSPLTAGFFQELVESTALPKGVLNTVHGLGGEAGDALVRHPGVNVISFTGSTAVGKIIARTAGERLAKVSLELGGKNPLVVCNDADIDNAVKWSLLSAFSNAGQRCAAGSRIIIFDSVYDEFRSRFMAKTTALNVGPADTDDLGPVINERQLQKMLKALSEAEAQGARIIAGGKRLADDAHRNGYYLAPTIVENANPDADISTTELFGPITNLYRVKNFKDAVAMANRSPYGLTACIHTCNVNRALEFTRVAEAGVVVVNGGTFGSEAHMPFGGVKQSGNGTREPGTEALDVYSNIKDVYQFIDRSAL